MKIISNLIISFLAIFSTISCTESDSNSEKLFDDNFAVKKISNLDVLNKISNSFNLKNGTRSNDFDFDEITEIYNHETNYTSFMIESNNNLNTKLGAYPTVEGNFNFLVIENIFTNDYKKVLYSDLDNNLLSEVTFDLINKTVEVVNHSDSTRGCGQATANCISTEYTQRGWWSVAGWVITLFQPWFGVVVAGSCAAYNCL